MRVRIACDIYHTDVMSRVAGMVQICSSCNKSIPLKYPAYGDAPDTPNHTTDNNIRWVTNEPSIYNKYPIKSAKVLFMPPT